MPTKTPATRKRLPKAMAVIDADNCTACETCLEICPIGCIEKVEPYAQAPVAECWCRVDHDRCIGCRQCIRVPGKKTDAHVLEVCPWGAIQAVPTAELLKTT